MKCCTFADGLSNKGLEEGVFLESKKLHYTIRSAMMCASFQ